MPNEEVKIRNKNCVLQTTCELFVSHGIENTTQDMIARASGVSKASVSRYFVNKVDCARQTAVWLSEKVRLRFEYMDGEISSGKFTGGELLEKYMTEIKRLFAEMPYLFILLLEFKAYVFRNIPNYETVYVQVTEALGTHNQMKRIYELGKNDGSFPPSLNADMEVLYISEFYREILAEIALTRKLTKQEKLDRIDVFIDRTLAFYKV